MEWILLIVVIILGLKIYANSVSISNLAWRIDELEAKVLTGNDYDGLPYDVHDDFVGDDDNDFKAQI